MSGSPSQSLSGETSTASAFSPRRAHEQRPAPALACPPAVAVTLTVLGIAALVVAFGAGAASRGVRIGAGVVTLAAVVAAPGFVVVAPNESRVLILFGRYIGTATEARLWWVNPFTVFWPPGQSVSL